jgi:hypothetical protein
VARRHGAQEPEAMPTSTIQYLTTVEFGAGALAILADAARALGIKRPLLVTALQGGLCFRSG